MSCRSKKIRLTPESTCSSQNNHKIRQARPQVSGRPKKMKLPPADAQQQKMKLPNSGRICFEKLESHSHLPTDFTLCDSVPQRRTPHWHCSSRLTYLPSNTLHPSENENVTLNLVNNLSVGVALEDTVTSCHRSSIDLNVADPAVTRVESPPLVRTTTSRSTIMLVRMCVLIRHSQLRLCLV